MSDNITAVRKLHAELNDAMDAMSPEELAELNAATRALNVCVESGIGHRHSLRHPFAAKEAKVKKAVASELKAVMRIKENKHELTRAVLDPLVHHQPRCRTMDDLRAVINPKSRPPATGGCAIAVNNFISNTEQRLRKELRHGLCEKIIVKSARKEFRHAARLVVMSRKSCCAGSLCDLTADCPYAVGQPQAREALDGDFVFDHLCSFSTIIKLIKYLDGARQLKKSNLPLVRHLLFGMRADPVYKWPPNVMLRCKACNRAGSTSRGEHKELFPELLLILHPAATSPSVCSMSSDETKQSKAPETSRSKKVKAQEKTTAAAAVRQQSEQRKDSKANAQCSSVRKALSH